MTLTEGSFTSINSPKSLHLSSEMNLDFSGYFKGKTIIAE